MFRRITPVAFCTPLGLGASSLPGNAPFNESHTLRATPLKTTDLDFNRRENSDHGGINIGTLITVLIFGAGLWVLFKVLPFFYYAEELRGFMESQAEKAQVLRDDEIRQTLLRKIKELQIPINDPEDLKVNRFNGNIVIELKYSEVLFIDLGDKTYDLYVFRFNPRVDRPES